MEVVQYSYVHERSPFYQEVVGSIPAAANIRRAIVIFNEVM